MIGNDKMTESRFCGILHRLINQKAEEMGRIKKGYEQFYIDELTNHADELPQEEKCIKSLLTKENILRHKRDERVAKRLLKQAKNLQAGQQSQSEERLNGKGDEKSRYMPYSLSQKTKIKTLDEVN